MVKNVCLTLDLELCVFLVAETLVVVDRYLQLVTDGFKFLIQKLV